MQICFESSVRVGCHAAEICRMDLSDVHTYLAYVQLYCIILLNTEARSPPQTGSVLTRSARARDQLTVWTVAKQRSAQPQHQPPTHLALFSHHHAMTKRTFYACAITPGWSVHVLLQHTASALLATRQRRRARVCCPHSQRWRRQN